MEPLPNVFGRPSNRRPRGYNEFRPSELRNPDAREVFKDEIQADERRQEEQQRQQATAEKERAAFERNAQNAQIEKFGRETGREFYSDPFGQYKWTHDDNTWQQKREQQRQKRDSELTSQWEKEANAERKKEETIRAMQKKRAEVLRDRSGYDQREHERAQKEFEERRQLLGGSLTEDLRPIIQERFKDDPEQQNRALDAIYRGEISDDDLAAARRLRPDAFRDFDETASRKSEIEKRKAQYDAHEKERRAIEDIELNLAVPDEKTVAATSERLAADSARLMESGQSISQTFAARKSQFDTEIAEIDAERNNLLTRGGTAQEIRDAELSLNARRLAVQSSWMRDEDEIRDQFARLNWEASRHNAELETYHEQRKRLGSDPAPVSPSPSPESSATDEPARPLIESPDGFRSPTDNRVTARYQDDAQRGRIVVVDDPDAIDSLLASPDRRPSEVYANPETLAALERREADILPRLSDEETTAAIDQTSRAVAERRERATSGDPAAASEFADFVNAEGAKYLDQFANGQISVAALNKGFESIGATERGTDAYKRVVSVKRAEKAAFDDVYQLFQEDRTSSTDFSVTRSVEGVFRTVDPITGAKRALRGLKLGAAVANPKLRQQYTNAKSDKVREQFAADDAAARDIYGGLLESKKAKLDEIFARHGLSDEQADAIRVAASFEGFKDRKKGLAEELADIGNNLAARLPFVGMLHNIDPILAVGGIATRMQAAEERGESLELSDSDAAMVSAFLDADRRDKTTMAKVAGVVSEIPGFIVELALTAGVGAVVRKGVQEGAEKLTSGAVRKLLSDKLADYTKTKIALKWTEGAAIKSLAGTAGVLAITPIVQSDKIFVNTLEKASIPSLETLGEYDDVKQWLASPGKPLLQAAAYETFDSAVEVGSEMLGGALLDPAFAKMAPWLKERALRLGLVQSLTKANPGKTPNQALSFIRRRLNSSTGGLTALVRRGGINSIPVEILEERAGDAMRGAAHFLTEGYVGDEWSLPSQEDFLVEVIAISSFGGAVAAINETSLQLTDRRIRKGWEKSAADSRPIIESTDPAEIAKAIQTRHPDAIITPDAIAAAQRQFGDLGALTGANISRDKGNLLTAYEQAKSEGNVKQMAAIGQTINSIEAGQSDAHLAEVITAAEIAESFESQQIQIDEMAVIASENNDPADIEAVNREQSSLHRASAAIKIGMGQSFDSLTSVEQQAMQEPTADGSLPLDMAGDVPIITDAARDEVLMRFPHAEAFLRLSETQARQAFSSDGSEGAETPDNTESPASPAESSSAAPKETAPRPAAPAAQGGGDWTAQSNTGRAVSIPASEASTRYEAEQKLAAKIAEQAGLGREMIVPESVTQAGAATGSVNTPQTQPTSTGEEVNTPDSPANSNEPAQNEITDSTIPENTEELKQEGDPASVDPAPTSSTNSADVSVESTDSLDTPAPAKTPGQSAAEGDGLDHTHRLKLVSSIRKGMGRLGKDAFPNGYRYAKLKHGAGIAYQDGTLLVDLNRLGKSFPTGSSKRLEAGVIEEYVHRIASDVLRPTEVEGLWERLPDSLKTVVRNAYFAAEIDAGAPIPAEVDTPFVMGHEFLRMVIQDKAFAGMISESVEVPRSFLAELVKLLKKLADRIKIEINNAPADVREDIQDYVSRILSRIDQANTGMAQKVGQRIAPARKTATPATPAKQSQQAEADDELDLSPRPVPRQTTDPQTGERFGDTGELILPDGSSLPFQYELVESGDIFRAPANDRDYTSNSQRAENEKRILNFQPSLIVNNNPTADTGPSIVDLEGEIQGGNRRDIILSDSRAYPVYREYLTEHAAEFGLDPAAVASMGSPRLIRRLLTEKADLNRALNDSAVGNIATLDNAISAARLVDDSIQTEAATLFDQFPDAAPLSTLQRPAARELSRLFLQSGIIRPGDRSKYTDASGFTDEGARLARYVLLASAIPNKSILSEVTDTPLETKLVAALPAFTRMQGRGVDITPLLDVVRAEVDRFSYPGKNKPSVAEHQGQQTMDFDGAGLSEGQRLLQQLLGDPSSRETRKVFTALTNTLAPLESNEISLTGETNRTSIDDITADEAGFIREGMSPPSGGGLLYSATISGDVPLPSPVEYDTISISHDNARQQLQDPGHGIDNWRSFRRGSGVGTQGIGTDAQFPRLGGEPQGRSRASEPDSRSQRVTPGDLPVEWARGRGLILKPGPLGDAIEAADKIYRGMEHDVFLDAPSRRMVKIAQDGFFGMHHPLDFGKYLERLALSNTSFGDQITFHGFVQMPGESFYSAVISQPFVAGREGTDTPADRTAINEFMRSRGFFADGRGASYTNPEKNLRATDAKGANFIIREDGTAFPIDLNVEALTSAQENPNQGQLFAASVGPQADPLEKLRYQQSVEIAEAFVEKLPANARHIIAGVSEGKDIADLAAEIDMPADEARKLYRNAIKLVRAKVERDMAKIADAPPSSGGRVDAAAAVTDTNPTPAQSEAGNYRKGRVTIQGLPISIENPRGSERSGTDKGGKAWSVTMAHHYGYIRAFRDGDGSITTEGKDGDHVDVFIGPNPDSAQVFVVNQKSPDTGRFDEHKVMLGFTRAIDAAKGYRDSYSPGWKGLMSMVPTSVDGLKGWLRDGDVKKPFTRVPSLSIASRSESPKSEPQADLSSTDAPQPVTHADAPVLFASTPRARENGGTFSFSNDSQSKELTLPPNSVNFEDYELRDRFAEALERGAVDYGTPLTGLRRKAERPEESFEQFTGIPVVYFRGENGQPGPQALGFVQPDWPHGIFLHVDGSEPVASSLAHEWAHIAEHDPAAAESLAGFIDEARQRADVDKLRAEVAAIGGEYPATAEKEVFFNLLSDALTGLNTWGSETIFSNPGDWADLQSLAQELFQNANPLQPTALGAEVDSELATSPDRPASSDSILYSASVKTLSQYLEDAGTPFESLTPARQAELLAEAGRQVEAASERLRSEGRIREDGTVTAPNGQPSVLHRTLLDEVKDPAEALRRYAMVHTSFFKRWFGDWEGVMRAEKLRSLPRFTSRVQSLDGLSGKALADAAKIVHQTLMGDFEMPDGRKIKITGRGFKEARHHSADARVMHIAADLRNLMDRSVLLWSEENLDPRHSNVRAFHNYGTRATVAGVDSYVRFLIREDNNGQIHYDHDATSVEAVTRNESGKPADPPIRKPSPGEDRAGLAENRLSQWLASVNPEMVSKVRDANGEPMVVWHGTPDNRALKENPAFDRTENIEKITDPDQLIEVQKKLDELSRNRDETGQLPDEYFDWLEKAGELRTSERQYVPVFSTEMKAVAATYADDTRAFDYQGADPEIFPFFKRMINPMEINAAGVGWGRRGGPKSQREQIAEAKSLGHDGIHIRRTRDTYQSTETGPIHDVFVSFSPNQIKSATGNDGTFTGSNNILHSASVTPEDQSVIDSAVAELSETIPVARISELPPRTPAMMADRAAMEQYEAAVFDAAAFARDEKFVHETFEMWDERARLEIEHDKAGVILRLLESANEGTGIRNAVDVRAAMILLPQMRREAMASRDPKRLAEIQALEYAYLEGGTENARAMAARRFSPYRSVAERHLAYLGSAMAAPPRAWDKRIKAAMTPAAKAAKIADIKEQIKKRMAGPGMKPESVRDEVRQLSAQLKEAEAAKDRNQVLAEAAAEKLARIEKELTASGISLTEIFNHDAVVKLRGGAWLKRQLERYSQSERKAIRAMVNGLDPKGIHKESGVALSGIEALRKRFGAHMRDEFGKLADRGVTLADFDGDLAGAVGSTMDASGRLHAASTAVDDAAKAAAEARDRIIGQFESALGLTEAQWTAQKQGRTKKVKTENGEQRFDPSQLPHMLQAMRAIQAADSTNGFDIAYEYWISNILSGPQTHAVNITGNAINIALEYGMQRWLEAAVNSIPGLKDPNGATFKEMRWMIKALPAAWSRAVSMSRIAWDTEAGMFESDVLGEDIQHVASKIEMQRFAIKGKKGRVIRMSGRSLNAADTAYKYFIGQIEAAAQGYRIANSEGLRGSALDSRINALVSTPGSAAWISAAAKAQELTYTTPLRTAKEGGGVIEDLVRKMQDARINRSGTTAGAASAFAMGLFFPFIRTPFNIFKAGLRRTPLAAAPTMTKLIKAGFFQMKDGKPFFESYSKALMTRDLVDQMIAWTTTGLLMGMVEGDDDDDEKTILITGSRPYGIDQKGDREHLDRVHGGPFQIRFGKAGPDATYFDFGRQEPIATTLGTIINALRGVKRVQHGKPWLDETGKIYSYMFDQAEEKTFLQGFSNISEWMRDPERKVKAIPRSIAQAIVPNLIRQPIRNLDDYVRESSSAPIYYHALPYGGWADPKLDLWGNPIEKAKVFGQSFPRVLADVGLKPAERPERGDEVITNWNRENPTDQYFPTPTRVDTWKDSLGRTHQMTREQKTEFLRRIGSTLAQRLRAEISPIEAERPTEETRRKMNSIRARITTDIKNQMIADGALRASL